MSSTRDYTRAETSDKTTNVPLLSEDSWDDGQLSDPVLVITDTVEDGEPDVRFSVSSAKDETSLGCPCKLQLTKTTVLVAIIAVLIIICIVLSALLTRSGKSLFGAKQEALCVTEGCIDAAHHMFHSMNRSVNPCDNFYEFACGGWAQNNPIPESKAFWGIYSVLQENNERTVRQLLTGAATNSEAIKKSKTFYDACMNLTAINKKGAKPLLDIMKKLGGWNVTQDWNSFNFDFNKTLQGVHRYSVPVFFNTDVDADDKNSAKNILKVIIITNEIYNSSRCPRFFFVCTSLLERKTQHNRNLKTRAIPDLPNCSELLFGCRLIRLDLHSRGLITSRICLTR